MRLPRRVGGLALPASERHDLAVRNLVVFLTDQQRWDTVGLNGCPLGLAPPEGSGPLAVEASLEGEPVTAALETGLGTARIVFHKPLVMVAGQSLAVALMQ